MRRLAYVCADDGVPVFGQKGCSVHVQEFLRASRQAGIAVELFAARIGGTPPPDLAGVPVHRLTPPPVWRVERGAIDDEVLAREQGAIARNQHVHATLAAQGRFDAIYERHALWSCGAMEYARAVGVVGLLEVNAPLLEEQQRHRVLRLRDEADAIVRRAFDAATAVLPVSDLLASWLGAIGVPASRIHVVPNAVRPERFAGTIVPAMAAVPGVVTVGFLGTLKPWHGLHVLVEALALMRRQDVPCRLLVVGDGPERAALERQASAAGLADAIVWAGSVAPADVPAWLAAMDLGVAPYADAEDCYFSPLKVFEYMAAGLPVVASGVGQLPAIVGHDTTGLLCAPGDAAALADALTRLCVNPDRRARLGAAARRHVLQHHTWARVVQRVRLIADEAAGGPRVPMSETRDTGAQEVRRHA
jgi:glycosyltransferase involved in cell wall biosynthesis